jgi:4-hydroxy-3-polyprenylbenzoate decarboxylase
MTSESPSVQVQAPVTAAGSAADLREWLRQVDALGQLKVVEDADWRLEIGALTEMTCLQSRSNHCLLFDRIKDYPPGWRLVSNSLATTERTALILNLPITHLHTDLVQSWRKRSKALQLTPMREVQDGPVLENVLHGADIDVQRFPAPVWHEDDGGRYLGTGDLVVTRDPDSGQINVGTYRMMIQDRDKLGLYMGAGQHGRIHRDKYFERGEPMPVAVAFGMHPLLFAAASLPLPLGLNEYEWAGAVQGYPVDVIPGPVTGLPFPANAEIVIEGYALPEGRLPEGPFGEYTGYYANPQQPEVYVDVRALYHRNDPIVLGSLTTRPPGEYYHVQNTIRHAAIWDALEVAGMPDVTGVSHLWGSTLGVLVVAIRQRFAGHAKHVGMVAAHTRGAGQFGRYVVVVDDDVDINSTDEVLWALWTRADPAESADLVRNCWSTALDPRLPPDKRAVRDFTHSKLVIDATRPFHWRADFPKAVGASAALKAKVRDKWGAEFFK